MFPPLFSSVHKELSIAFHEFGILILSKYANGRTDFWRENMKLLNCILLDTYMPKEVILISNIYFFKENKVL